MTTPTCDGRSYCRFRLLLLACVAAACCLAGCADRPDDTPGDQQIWRFAVEEAEGSVQHAYAVRFKELVEARTDGAVKVIVYPYGTLGTSTHMTEQLNLGVLEFAMASPGSLGKFIPELQVFLLHFVLSDDERENRELLSDPQLISDFDKLYAPKGLKLLSIFSEGEMVWTMKKEVRRPSDFRGVKMRVMTSPLLLAAYRAYGASPTPLPYSEVYSALQLNMIDGQVNPVFAIERQKFHEVTTWMIFPRHASFITSCAANREFFETLPDPRKKMVLDIIDELDDYIFDVQTGLQAERLKVILRDKKRQRATWHVCGDLDRFRDAFTEEEQRMYLDENPFLQLRPGLTDEERAQFRRASREVRDAFLAIGGPKSRAVLNRLLEATGR